MQVDKGKEESENLVAIISTKNYPQGTAVSKNLLLLRASATLDLSE